jgi:hypothetical protein
MLGGKDTSKILCFFFVILITRKYGIIISKLKIYILL